MRVRRLSLGNPGDLKPVGAGVSEMRIDQVTASITSNAGQVEDIAAFIEACLEEAPDDAALFGRCTRRCGSGLGYG